MREIEKPGPSRKRSLASEIAAVASLLFLERCRICHAHCAWVNEVGSGARAETRSVCVNCWQALSAREPAVDWCILDQDSSFKVASGAQFKGHLKKLIYHLKYDGDRLIAGDLALLLVRAWSLIAGDLSSLPVVFVPIPLHRERRRSRKYNQAQLVASSAARRLGVKMDAGALRRVKPTVAQHGLGRAARLANLQDAFACDQKRVSGKAVVLVDDVHTSGSTLAEAGRTVMRGGAVKVVGLTVARAVLSRGKDFQGVGCR